MLGEMLHMNTKTRINPLEVLEHPFIQAV